jgi:Short C-terminal domain
MFIMIRRPIGRTVARTAVIAGTATAVSGGVARRQGARYAEQEAPQAPPPPEAAAAPPPSAGPSPDDIEQLKQLAALKDQGVLTEEEFAAQKAKILGT